MLEGQYDSPICVINLKIKFLFSPLFQLILTRLIQKTKVV